jgi:hypothetical protein
MSYSKVKNSYFLELKPQPFYNIYNTSQNNLSTITNWGTTSVICPISKIELVDVYLGIFSRSKLFHPSAFNYFRQDLSAYIDSINRRCSYNFLTVNDKSWSGDDTITITDDENCIKTVEDYLVYWEYYSKQPTLLFLPNKSNTPLKRRKYFPYNFSLLNTNTKLSDPFKSEGYYSKGINHYPFIHLILENSTYFVKFEWRSSLSDYSEYKSIESLSLRDLMHYNMSELFDEYGFDYNIHRFGRIIKKGIVSHYIVLPQTQSYLNYVEFSNIKCIKG